MVCRDVVLAKSALHALNRLQTPQPQATYSAAASVAPDSINTSVRMAACWQDIQLLLGSAPASAVTATNVTYALFRLGCMYCLAAPQRQAQIKDSGLLDHLFNLAYQMLPDCRAPQLVHIMDACARLRFRPPTYMLNAIAARAQHEALAFTPHQLPLLMWGFASVGFKPRDAVQQVLNEAVQLSAVKFAPQGVSLTLWAFASLHHVPAESVLDALVASWEAHVSSFKPHELANCLESCAALSYDPGQRVKAAIASRMGMSHIVRKETILACGKPSLTPGAKPIVIAAAPTLRPGLNRLLAKALAKEPTS